MTTDAEKYVTALMRSTMGVPAGRSDDHAAYFREVLHKSGVLNDLIEARDTHSADAHLRSDLRWALGKLVELTTDQAILKDVAQIRVALDRDEPAMQNDPLAGLTMTGRYIVNDLFRQSADLAAAHERLDIYAVPPGPITERLEWWFEQDSETLDQLIKAKGQSTDSAPCVAHLWSKWEDVGNGTESRRCLTTPCWAQEFRQAPADNPSPDSEA